MGKNGTFRATGVGVSNVPGVNPRFNEQVKGTCPASRGRNL